jgi:rhodanese-related sulfurtransferase
MPKDIERDEVRRLINSGAFVIEVLPADEYREFHLPSATNVPLEKIDAQTTAHLAEDKPIVTYCHDSQ